MFCSEDFKTAEKIADLLNKADVVYCAYGSYAEVLYGTLKKESIDNDFDFLVRSDNENLRKACDILEKNFETEGQMYEYVVSKIIVRSRTNTRFELLFSDVLCPKLSKRKWPWSEIKLIDGIKSLPLQEFTVLKQHDFFVLGSEKEKNSLERILGKHPEINAEEIKAKAKEIYLVFNSC